MSILKIENIKVQYDNIIALHNISMQVEKGQIVTLIGANGAGKSSLLKSIVALEPLSEGQIYYKDQILVSSEKHQGLTTSKMVNQGIALVPEGRNVFADLSVEENLDMGAFSIDDKNLIARKKEEMYDFFPILGKRRKQKSKQLSGGEQQMLAIARALMISPELLLLDEPGLGLAPLIIADIFDKLNLINKEDEVTIFIVEQNAKLALKYCNYAYVMENGRIVLENTKDKLLNNDEVRSAYLGI